MLTIKRLAEELLSEDKSGEVPEAIQKLLAKLVYTEPFAARLFSRATTDYIKQPSWPTAGVRSIQGRIEFGYNPTWLNELSQAELNFLLKHEIYHIIRSHGSRGVASGATTKALHDLSNIASDALINADCEKEGGLGGLPSKVIEGAWFIEEKPTYGSINKTWGKDSKDKYTGPKMTEPLYKWMLAREKARKAKNKEDDKDAKGGKEGEAPPWEPDIGDIVYNKKTKQYGKVTSRYGTSIKTEVISEQEAEEILKSSQFTKNKQANNSLLKKKSIGDNDLWA